MEVRGDCSSFISDHSMLNNINRDNSILKVSISGNPREKWRKSEREESWEIGTDIGSDWWVKRVWKSKWILPVFVCDVQVYTSVRFILRVWKEPRKCRNTVNWSDLDQALWNTLMTASAFQQKLVMIIHK